MKLTPTQNLAVDLLIIAYDRENHTVKLYTPKREVEPAKGQPALPGVLVQEGEHISSAVKRTLDDKTTLDSLTYTLQELPARTNPFRDERGHVVSIPTLVLLHNQLTFDDDWVDFKPGLTLPFDHADMVNLAYHILANNWDKHPLPLFLAGSRITLEETRDILAHFQPYYEKVLASNLRQMSFVQKFLMETNEFVKTKTQGRPPRYYAIKRDDIKPLYQ